VFKRLKDDGKSAGSTKSQVDLVPAHSVIWLYLVDRAARDDRSDLCTAIKREINKCRRNPAQRPGDAT
jgi:hypothetical protein